MSVCSHRASDSPTAVPSSADANDGTVAAGLAGGRPYREVAGAGRRVPVGVGVDVEEVDRRRRVQQHRTVQPGVVPVVLVLQVGRRTPTHDRERQLDVVTGAHELAHIELLRQSRIGAHPDEPTTHLDLQDGLGATDVEHDPPIRPLGGHRTRRRYTPVG